MHREWPGRCHTQWANSSSVVDVVQTKQMCIRRRQQQTATTCKSQEWGEGECTGDNLEDVTSRLGLTWMMSHPDRGGWTQNWRRQITEAWCTGDYLEDAIRTAVSLTPSVRRILHTESSMQLTESLPFALLSQNWDASKWESFSNVDVVRT